VCIHTRTKVEKRHVVSKKFTFAISSPGEFLVKSYDLVGICLRYTVISPFERCLTSFTASVTVRCVVWYRGDDAASRHVRSSVVERLLTVNEQPQHRLDGVVKVRWRRQRQATVHQEVGAVSTSPGRADDQRAPVLGVSQSVRGEIGARDVTGTRPQEQPQSQQRPVNTPAATVPMTLLHASATYAHCH